MNEPSAPLRNTYRRTRFSSLEASTTGKRRALPFAPVSGDDATSADDEVRKRCEMILEQVAEINGLLQSRVEFPRTYAEACRDRLVEITNQTEEVLDSVLPASQPPGSMSSWRLRHAREGGSDS